MIVRNGRLLRRYSVCMALLGLAGCLLRVPAVAHACALDSRPSAYADGQRDRVNTQVPTNSAQLAGWAPFVFAHSYPVRRAIVLTEDRREVARTLTAAAMRRPWRWEFGDGQVAYGWTVRHAYAHPGHWRISVDAYDPGTRQWYNFDQIAITISAEPRHAPANGTTPRARSLAFGQPWPKATWRAAQHSGPQR
jgi:PKD domain